MAHEGLGCAKRLADAAADRDMVVLDEHGVIEAEAVVHGAAAAHRVFFKSAQAGRRLARAADIGVGVGDQRHIFRGHGRDARHARQIVQRGALGGEDRAGVARHARHRGAVARHARAILHQRFKANAGVDQPEGGLRDGQAADHAGLAHGEDGGGLRARRDRRQRGDVARAAKVFVKGGAHGVFEIDRIEEGHGHEGFSGRGSDQTRKPPRLRPWDTLRKSSSSGQRRFSMPCSWE